MWPSVGAAPHAALCSRSSEQAIMLLAMVSVGPQMVVAGPVCPGKLQIEGYGQVNLVNAFWNLPGDQAGPVHVEAVNESNHVVPGMKGRTYFADACSPNGFDHNQYVAMHFLGHRLRWTTDISGAGCGCNAALYLAPLKQNSDVSGCDDYYCDSNTLCGVACADIDLQEANMYAFHSTLHVFNDGTGVGAGYGGGGQNWNHDRQWRKEDYGPGARCIDTSKPFQVAVAFPLTPDGKLRAMDVLLSQEGSPCDLSAEVSDYRPQGRDGMAELAEALAVMTPIISYWSSIEMLWMDGKGADGLGPCEEDDPSSCASSVRFYDFAFESIHLNLT
ncbi:unnamed protein product [Polarella glacialis]|uniref:Cellulase n=1 Tax=Polarella glacialis TaxID=89957 RepID=A0A813DKF6_POLGL|nr:unnamed protein product [Polarella glacialis]